VRTIALDVVLRNGVAIGLRHRAFAARPSSAIAWTSSPARKYWDNHNWRRCFDRRECGFPHGYCGKLDRRRHPGAHSSAQRSRCRNLDSVAPPEPIDR